MAKKQPLAPLIPLDDLKKVVSALARVPKDEIEKTDVERVKRPKGKTKNVD